MATLHIWKTVFRASPLADLNENQLMRRGMRPKHDIIISNQSLSFAAVDLCIFKVIRRERGEARGV